MAYQLVDKEEVSAAHVERQALYGDSRRTGSLVLGRVRWQPRRP